MLTKREACLAVIRDFCAEKGIDPEDLTDDHVRTSVTKLIVAMEYLGLIKDKFTQEFAATIGGTILSHIVDGEMKTLTFREILNFLPEDEEKGKIKWTNIK